MKSLKKLLTPIKQHWFNYLFFFLPYCILLIRQFITTSNILTGSLNIIALILLFVSSCKTFLSTSNNNKIIIALSLLIASLVFLNTGNIILLKYTLIITSLPNTNIKMALKADFLTRCIIYFSIITLSCTGIINETVALRSDMTRHSLGFYHPNTLAIQTIILCVEILYLRLIKRKVILFPILIVAFMIIFFVANSRTGLIIFISFILFFVATKYHPRKIKAIAKPLLNVLPLIYPTLTALLYVSLILFNLKVPLFQSLNEVLSGRLGLASWGLQPDNIHLFGNAVPIGTDALVLDAAPFHILFFFGVVPFCSILLLLPTAVKTLNRRHLYIEACIFTIFIISAMTEQSILRPTINPFMLFCAAPFFPTILKRTVADGEKNV